ncbi:MAG: hypothetical protein R6T78_03545 [Dehalococcoidales bacterium]
MGEEAMSDLNEFVSLIEQTEKVKSVIRSVKLEPARLLCSICRDCRKTGAPVPDYSLNLVGYLLDVPLRALLSAGLIEEKSGGRRSLYIYQPTEKGLEQCEKMKNADFRKLDIKK